MGGSAQFENHVPSILKRIEEEQKTEIKGLLMTIASHLPIKKKVNDLKGVMIQLHSIGLITTKEMNQILNLYETKKGAVPY